LRDAEKQVAEATSELAKARNQKSVVDPNGFESARYLRQQNPTARLFGIEIGYNVAASFRGVMERTSK
jgi:hypothetical protein